MSHPSEKYQRKPWEKYQKAQSREPIDVEANRAKAVGKFIEGLPFAERVMYGIREPVAAAGNKLDRLMGIENPEAEQGLAYSREAGDLGTGFGRAITGVATLGKVPVGVIPSAVAGAAYGAATAEDSAKGAIAGGVGGAAGSVIGGIAGRAVNATAGKWAERAIQGSDDTAKTLREFQRLGGRLTPGQASGNRVSQFADDALANNPLTASTYASIEKNNQSVLNRTLAKALGIESKGSIGPSALQAADDAVNKQFNFVADKLTDGVPVNEATANDIVGLLSERTVKPFLSKLQTGRITGRDYMDIRSKLLAITRRQGSDKVDDAWALIDDLDETVEGIAPEGYNTVYAAARERYKTLLSVDKYRRAISGGDANAATLEGAVRSVFGKQYTRDAPTYLPETNELFTVLRALSDPRMAPLTGGSQTAKRILPWATGSGMIGGAALDPVTTAAVIAGGYLAPRVAMAAPSSAAARQIGGAVGSSGALEIERRK